jgi:hypothetical protein
MKQVPSRGDIDLPSAFTSLAQNASSLEVERTAAFGDRSLQLKFGLSCRTALHPSCGNHSRLSREESQDGAITTIDDLLNGELLALNLPESGYRGPLSAPSGI